MSQALPKHLVEAWFEQSCEGSLPKVAKGIWMYPSLPWSVFPLNGIGMCLRLKGKKKMVPHSAAIKLACSCYKINNHDREGFTSKAMGCKVALL
jgi:hypothetical protein